MTESMSILVGGKLNQQTEIYEQDLCALLTSSTFYSAPQMPAEFFLEVTMEAYERARIFPSLMVMPGYKQNPLSPS